MNKPLISAADGAVHPRLAWRAVAIAVAVTAAMALVLWPRLPVRYTWEQILTIDDAHHYASIAHGRMHDAAKPFANRFLHPQAVRGLSRITGLSINESFAVVAVAGALLFTLFVALFLHYVGVLPPVIAAILLTPFLVALFREMFLPDLAHAALGALFFWLLLRERWWMALLVLLLMQCVRESTIALAVMTFLLTIRRRPMVAAGVVLVSVVGIAIATVVTRPAQPNIHAMGTALYMLLKLPFNFAKNVMGLILWTDSLPGMQAMVPRWSIDLPSWIPAGRMRSIGIVGFDLVYPLTTLAIMLTQFGIAPSIATRELLRRRARLLREEPLWLVIPLLYGLAVFFLGPMLGAAVSRLTAYGWPAFVIATPAMVLLRYRLTSRGVAMLVVLHVVTCWAPWVVMSRWSLGTAGLLVVVALATVPHVIALRMLHVTSSSAGRSAPAPT